MATPTDTTIVPSATSTILGLQSTAAEDTAAATGQGAVAQGTAIEAGAYGTAATLANQNAQLEQVSGAIQGYQAQRELEQGIGTQSADVSGAGFASSGSNLDAIRSSYQKGFLNEQLIGTQSQIKQAGYLEQASASTAEQAAANVAASSATSLQGSYTTAAATATTDAANETATLLGYIKATQPPGAPISPTDAFSESLLSGTPGSPVSAPKGQWINQNGTWVYGNSNTTGTGTVNTPQTPSYLTGGSNFPGIGQTVI